jgi:type I restriction enzyme M protein
MAAPPWSYRITCCSRLGLARKVRKNLLDKCNVHTLLRLSTGFWYSPGVKANVLFSDKKRPPRSGD